jgi:hypothetical protein
MQQFSFIDGFFGKQSLCVKESINPIVFFNSYFSYLLIILIYFLFASSYVNASDICTGSS